MVKGIGIDAVVIGDIADLLARMSKGVLSRIFTEGELSSAQEKADPAEYLASRFAVKEAAFKAIAPNLPAKGFDYRRTTKTEAHTSMLTSFLKRYWTALKLQRFLFP